MANKNFRKANKIVTKATEAFSDTILKVEKANDILAEGINKDNQDIIDNQAKIKDLELEILESEKSKALKHEQIESNAILINQLSSFTPGRI